MAVFLNLFLIMVFFHNLFSFISLAVLLVDPLMSCHGHLNMQLLPVVSYLWAYRGHMVPSLSKAVLEYFSKAYQRL